MRKSNLNLLVARSPKVMLYILLLTLISMYSTNKPGLGQFGFFFFNKQNVHTHQKGTLIPTAVDAGKFGQFV